MTSLSDWLSRKSLDLVLLAESPNELQHIQPYAIEVTAVRVSELTMWVSGKANAGNFTIALN